MLEGSTEDSIEIIKANPSHFEAIRELVHGSHLAAFDAIGEDERPELPEIFPSLNNLDAFIEPKSHYWVALYNSQVVGAISLIDETTSGEINCFYVSLHLRGRGIGSKLINQALSFARESKYEKVHLISTRDVYAGAISLYEKLGFVHTGVIPTKSFICVTLELKL